MGLNHDLIRERQHHAQKISGRKREIGRAGVPAVPWSADFEDPVSLPNGRQLVTLKDAATYITKLPKAEQQAAEWQTAVPCLIGAAEGRDFLMHARSGCCGR